MPGTVFLSGGSGFVGNAVLEELIARDYRVHALANSKDLPADDRVKSFKGGLFDADVVRQAISGCDAVIHLVGIIMEHPSRGQTFDRIHYEGTKQIVDAAQTAGVRRYVQMSALARDPMRPANITSPSTGPRNMCGPAGSTGRSSARR